MSVALVVDNTASSPSRSRRRAAFSQADISRFLRAAEKRNGWRVEFESDGVVIRLTREPAPITAPEADNGRGLGIVP
jgi:hypothetical protein